MDIVKFITVVTHLFDTLQGMSEWVIFVFLLISAGMRQQHQNSTSVNFISSALRLGV
jgi:hypothetical protein